MSLRRSLKESNGELWQIEKVLDRKKVDGTTQYLIKWEVEDDEEIENSWHTEYELEMLNVENLHLLAEADARKKTKSNTKHHTPKKQPTAFDALVQSVHADSLSKERIFQKQQREIRQEAEKKATKEYQEHLDALQEQEKLTDPPFQLDAPLHVAMLKLSGSADSETEESENAARLSPELANAWASALRIKNVFGEFLMLFMENPNGFEGTLNQLPLFANYPQHTERLRQMCSQSLPFLRLYERCDSHLDWDISKDVTPAPSPFANMTQEQMERDHPFCFPVEVMVHIFEMIFPLPVNDELISKQLKANRLVCQYWYYILNQQSSWHFFTLLRFPTFKSMIQRRNNVTAYVLNLDDGSLPVLYETRLVTKRTLLAEINWHRTFDFLNRKWARYETIWTRPSVPTASNYLVPFTYLDENADVTRNVLDFLFLHYIAKLGQQSTALYLNLPELSETSTFGVIAAMNYWFDNCSGVFDIPGMNAEEFGTFRTNVESLFGKIVPYEMRDKNMYWWESGALIRDQKRFLSLRAKGTKNHIVHDRKLFRSAKKRGVGWLTHSERALPYEHYLLIDSCTPRLFVHYGGNGKIFFDKQRNTFLGRAAIERQIDSEAFNLFMFEAKSKEKNGDYKFQFRCVDQHLTPGAEISPHVPNFPRFLSCFAQARYEYFPASMQYGLYYYKSDAAKLDKIGNWDYKNDRLWTFTLQVKRIRWCPIYYQWRLFGSKDYSVDRTCMIAEDLDTHTYSNNRFQSVDEYCPVTSEETLRKNPYGY